mmetsp:Transcript_6880/g.13708  ORF Transcript_6880/g.13708 Transcript_6880/m.13708 type:complete len:374 (-) Transcript_6880:202-1323(-)
MSRLSKLACVLLALCAGACLATQSAMNGALKVPLDSGLMASMISFVVGVATLLLIVPFSLWQKPRDQGPNPRPLYWWLWCAGGLIGVYYVVSATFLGPKLGFGLFFASVIAGQLICSILVDHFAFLDLTKKPATVWRIGSMLVVFAGAIMAIVDKIDAGQVDVGRTVGYVIVSFIAGCGMTIQAPINSAFTIRRGTLPHRTALLSFSVGTVMVILIWGVSVGVIGGGLSQVHTDETVWWMYLGGVLGVVYVVAAIALAPILGIAWFFIAVIAGQLLMSLFIDSFGLFNSTKIRISALRIVGVVLVFVGAASFRLLPLQPETMQKLRSVFPGQSAKEKAQGDDSVMDTNIDAKEQDIGIEDLSGYSDHRKVSQV